MAWLPRGTPTFEGRFGKAWRVKNHQDEMAPKAWQSAVVSYQVHRPGAHPWWEWYVIGCVSLRDIEGAKPANKHYQEAEYEIHFFALDPDAPIPDPDEPTHLTGAGYTSLEPPELVHQFHGISNEQAYEFMTSLIQTIVVKGLSPDSDFQSYWKKLIANSVEHIALGGHPKGTPS